MAIVVLSTMLALSVYGTAFPATTRCHLPGAVGCPGGLLGPAVTPAGAGNLWYDVTMYDWGFWIVDSTSGANVSGAWNVFEGWTVHVNATSLPPDAAIGGQAYHGLGVELNATGQQLLSLAAPVGQWVTASFVAPTSAYYHQHIWCTIQCGPGHSSQQEYILNVIPAVPLPLATASANQTIGPAPLSVGVSGNASSGTAPYNLSWNFGDGSPLSYGPSAHHTYTLGGVYYATLTVTDAKGNAGRAVVTITVLSSAPLSAVLTGRPAAGAAPLAVTFGTVVHGGTPPYAFAWNYGDGVSGAGGNASTHVFTVPGVFTASVAVSDSAGATIRALFPVVVSPATGTLTVAVNATSRNGTVPFLTTFGASASGGTAPYSFAWVFGDGSTGSGPSVSHQYNYTGSYEVLLFASDAAGGAGLAVLNVAVTNLTSGGGGDGGGDNLPYSLAATGTGALTVRVTPTPPSGSPPLAVRAVASIENGTGSGETVTWTFGDGGSATGQDVNHTYSSAGNYNMTVTATDSAGNTGTTVVPVRVGGPTISIVANRTAGDAPFSVVVGASVEGGSGVWTAINWTWGDGGSSSGALANHSYAATTPTNYTVSATAVDSLGSSVTGSVTLSVTAGPSALLAVSLPTTPGLPANVSLTLTVHGGSGGYPSDALWTFGDQTSTRGPFVESHDYNRTGHFLVTVETNDSSGHLAIASAWVNLSSALALPRLPKGQNIWVFTGVPDPETAALVMMGLVGGTGLLFLVRKRRRQTKKPGAATAGKSASVGSRSLSEDHGGVR